MNGITPICIKIEAKKKTEELESTGLINLGIYQQISLRMKQNVLEPQNYYRTQEN